MTHWIRRSALVPALALLALASPALAQVNTTAPIPNGEITRLSTNSNSGTLSANSDYVELYTANYASGRLDIVGSFTGTVTLTCSVDNGTTYRAITMNGPAPSNAEDTDGAVTTGGQYAFNA